MKFFTKQKALFLAVATIGLLMFTGCAQRVAIQGKTYNIPATTMKYTNLPQELRAVRKYRICKRNGVLMDTKMIGTGKNNDATPYIKKNVRDIKKRVKEGKTAKCIYPMTKAEIAAQKASDEQAKKAALVIGAVALGVAAASASSGGGYSGYTPSYIPSYSSPTSSYSQKSSGCTSDFSCGSGQKCVKKKYSSHGVCMNVVNKYGNKQYGAKRSMSSYGVNMGNSGGCKGIMDCPTGFKCDRGTGSCIRRNFKKY